RSQHALFEGFSASLSTEREKAEMLTSEGLLKGPSVLTRRLAKPGAVLTSGGVSRSVLTSLRP
ncbi:MAG TPA: hypothetical protein VFY54_17155, partial [Rubrobacter sp.]|nr:hypothetical protein [Rubrobacter sp.]